MDQEYHDIEMKSLAELTKMKEYNEKRSEDCEVARYTLATMCVNLKRHDLLKEYGVTAYYNLETINRALLLILVAGQENRLFFDT